MKKIFILVAVGIGTIALVFLLARVFASEEQVSRGGSSGNGGTPRADISETFIDLGTMGVNEERSKDLRITNNGNAPLELSRIRTSCGCTIAEVTIGGQKLSFNMEMHNPIGLRKWKGVLAPGESATIRVIYRPYVMPVQGKVERLVLLETNDPNQKTMTITLNAVVQ